MRLKKNILLYPVLLFPLIVDILIGLFLVYEIDIPIGKLYRGALYLVGATFLLFYKRKKFYALFLLVWGFFFFFWILFSEDFSFFREIVFFLKCTYLFVILHLIKIIPSSEGDKNSYLDFILKRYAQTVAVMIIFSFVTNIGLETYGEWVFGTSSFFVAQNDIGLTQLLAFTYLLFNQERVKINWLWVSLIFISMIMLGTTTSMFGSVAVLLLFVIFKWLLQKILSLKNLLFRMCSIVILVGIISSTMIFLIGYIQQSSYYNNKYEKILSEGFRSPLKEAGKEYLTERGIVKNIFGEGFSSYTTNLGQSAPYLKLSKKNYADWLLVETAPYDFLGAYGILLSALLFSYYIFVLLLSSLNYYNERSIYNLSLLIVFGLAIFHAIFAGHVLSSPTVLGILAIIIYKIQSSY